MLMLLSLIELLRTVYWRQPNRFLARAFIRRSYKRLHADSRHQHLHAQCKPEWIKEEIIRLKALMPQAGCRTIADICNRRFAASHQLTVGKTFVYETLQRHAYDVTILRRDLKHAKPKSIPRNLIWGLDLTGKTDAKGKLHPVLGILDHGSRALLLLQALHDKSSHSLIACITEIIRTYGKPKIIRTDNEAIFTSRVFRRGLKLLGIRHQLTTPGCPWQNGRIERLFGTLKNKLDQWVVAGFKPLNADLRTFQYWYNHIRPHQNLDGRTPAEAWSGIDPYAKPARLESWFEAWDGLLSGYHLRY